MHFKKEVDTMIFMPKIRKHIHKTTVALLLFYLFMAGISFWIMFHTFGYDSSIHSMLLASRVWSDFGAHIPLIRSFSLGHNWPPQYPLFPGEPIRYHFLFYAMTGFLEILGIRIDIALNLLSAIGFFFMLYFSYRLSVTFFQKKTVGVLTVIFILFNGTLSFLNYFKGYSTLLKGIQEIPSLHNFPSFGPWDHSMVTAFGNLNVYTNQRHLGFSFAVVLGIVYLLFYFRKEKISLSKTIRLKKFTLYTIPSKPSLPLFTVLSITIALLMSSLLFLNQAALLPAVILVAGFFLVYPELRYPLLWSTLLSIPFLAFFFQIAQPTGHPVFEPGYLSEKPLSMVHIIRFWFYNLGLHILLIPIGMILAPKKIRWFALPLLLIFLLPNIFRFSTDMINNHKFFNLFMIFGSMYSAFAIVTFTRWLKRKKLVVVSLVIIPIIILFSTFSGLLDFWVVTNDYYITLPDIAANPDALFIAEHTSPQAVILNSTWFYNPASIAGRKIYNGYSFFTWSAGYDTYPRENITKEIYHAQTLPEACALLTQEHIDYVEINSSPEKFLLPISTLWKTLTPVFYINRGTGVTLYSTKNICL